jgi:hypothetical protein
LSANYLGNRVVSFFNNLSLAPTALLYSNSTVVEGNLIQNFGKAEAGPAGGPPSPPVLSLYVSSSSQSPLAVTGNVFLGTSVMPERDDIAKFDGAVLGQLNSWRFLNYHKSDRPQ